MAADDAAPRADDRRHASAASGAYALELARGLAPARRARRPGDDGRAAHAGSSASDAARIATADLHESALSRSSGWTIRGPTCARAGDWLLALEAELRPDVVHLNQFALRRAAVRRAEPGRRPFLRAVVVARRARRGRAARVGSLPPRRCAPAWPARRRRRADPGDARRAASDTTATRGAGRSCCRTAAAPTMFAPARKAAARSSPRAACGTRRRTSLRWKRSRRACLAGARRRRDGDAGRRACERRAAWSLLGRAGARGARARALACARSTPLPARYEPFGLGVLEAGAGRLRAGARRHREPARDLGRRGALRRRPTITSALRARLCGADRRPGAARALGRARARRARASSRRSEWPTPISPPMRALVRRDAAPRPGRRARGRRCASWSSATRWSPTGTTATRTSCAASCARAAGARPRRRVYEPRDGWSRRNLVAEHGDARDRRFAQRLSRSCAAAATTSATLDLDAALDDADLVLVHEWNEPALVRADRPASRATRRLSAALSRYAPPLGDATAERWRAYDLRHYDGVLAFGEVIRELYLPHGWAARAWTWHEAADYARFHPLPARAAARATWSGSATGATTSATASCDEFLLEPVRTLGLRGTVHGVRYPEQALAALPRRRHRLRRLAAELRRRRECSPAIASRCTCRAGPMSRRCRASRRSASFEALACGIPLVSRAVGRRGRPVHARARLPGRRADGAEMRRHLDDVLHDQALAQALAEHGRATIRARHTCAHRVDELLDDLRRARRRLRT